MHHAYSDTEKDPHSPHHTENLFTMMWETKNVYNDLIFNKMVVDPQFDNNYPEWKFIDTVGENAFYRVIWGTFYALLYIAAYIWLDMPWYLFFLLPIHWLMGPIHGAIVNWSGHKYGYSNYDNNDKSKNSLILDFLMLGELFQNNHHKLPNRVNFGTKWFEFDPTYPIIRFLDWVKIIRLKTA